MYIRLSREDGDKQESESIGNQRKILQRYIKESNLDVIQEYVDDGISGTTFNRPSFNKMIDDIENGTINMVITKDLSRLGRDYIKTGYYLEDYFPKNNVRYVAITDGIDTYIDSTNNDITPFKAIMNDMYAKDISKKIRSVLKEKQKQGEYMCSIPAYGYKRHPSIKNKLIIDEQVKDVVEKIFDMYANSHGSVEIVKFLNSKKYLSPTGYRKTGIVQDENKTGYDWNEVTLCNILKNEVYIGNTVQNKKSVISYKVKKIRTIEKENQIRVDNTHEAIIDKDTFEKVQCIIEKRGTNTKLKYDYLLRGLLYCYHCKRKLQIVLKKNSKRNAKSHPYITCSDAKERGCYPLNMNYEKFEKHIINIVKKICQIYADKEIFYSIYINDKIRMYEKSKITMYKHTFFFVYFYWRYTKMEKLITQLRILKEMNLKPNYSALAREYGCDRRTVKKYNNGYTGGGNTRNKKSKLDKYLPIIQEKLQYKGIHIKSVYEFLIDKFSFENIGTYSNFHKYVVKHKLLVNKNTSKTVRFETLPGKQAQVDWKEDITMISKYGEIFKFNVFSFKLGNSRYVYYEYRKEKTREDLFECLINAFKFIGGVPQEILFDNMSSVVDVNTGKINSKFLAFSKDMGFKVKRCKPRHPKTKGKVESCNKFVEWLIPYNNEFEDETQLIDLIHMINSKVNSSVNQTTRVTPNFLFQKEKEYFLPIPKQTILEQYTKRNQKYLVYPDSLINFNNKKYSVPSKYIGQYVYAQQIDSYLYIYLTQI